MTSREEALREVLLEAADEIDASRLQPLRPTERGWGRSVHTIQRMPPTRVCNTYATMQAIVAARVPV